MVNNLAFVFPGQGSQSTNMLADFYENFSIFKQVLEESSDAIGYDIWSVITDEDSTKLNQTQYTQPALLAASYGLWRVWREEGGLLPDVLAGHSLGEYTALVAADSLNLSDATRLVSERGKFMQNAVEPDKGAMAAIIGLDDNKVDSICDEASDDKSFVAPANYNSPGQVVIAGEKNAVIKAQELAKVNGARRVVLLPVSVPSHCSLMNCAADDLGNLLHDIDFKEPKIPVIHNFDVSPHSAKPEICDVLIQQLYNPVRWVETVQSFSKYNVEKIIECGPGKVLTGLNKRIDKNINSISINNIEDLKKELATEMAQ